MVDYLKYVIGFVFYRGLFAASIIINLPFLALGLAGTDVMEICPRRLALTDQNLHFLDALLVCTCLPHRSNVQIHEDPLFQRQNRGHVTE
jgi:hypothetical protein